MISVIKIKISSYRNTPADDRETVNWDSVHMVF